MSEKTMCKVIPFKASVSRIKRGAEAYRRRGKMVEAIELLRQAAKREDSARAWFRLGQQLRQVHCYEEAAEAMCRALAWADCPMEVFVELSHIMQMLGRWDAALSCLMNDLQYNPYSGPATSELYEMMMEADSMTHMDFREPFRLTRLMQRAGRAYLRGETVLGERRYSRALRLTTRRARIYRIQGASRMEAGREKDALRPLVKALALERNNVQIMTMLAQCYDALGKRRLAWAMMARGAAACQTPQDEQSISDAWVSLGDFRRQRKFLEARLKRYPYRIALMHPMADVLWILGDEEGAQRWWRRIQTINTEDLRARSMLVWAREHRGEPLLPRGLLPEEEQEWLSKIVMLGMLGSEIEKPDYQEQLELALRWALRQQSWEGQTMMVRSLALEDRPWARRRLREVLASATSLPEVKQEALETLLNWGDVAPKYINLSGYIIMTEKDYARRKPTQGLWKVIALALLRETGRSVYRDDLLGFAWEIWRGLPMKERQRVVLFHRHRWVKAFQLYYFRLHGMEDEAALLLRELPISQRKVERVVRSLARRTHLMIEGEHTP